MNNEINLIASKRKSKITRGRAIHVTNIFTVVFIIVSGLVSLVLFLANNNTSIQQLTTQKQGVERQLSFVQDKVTNLIILKNRLQNIQTIFTNRISFENTLVEISNMIPSDVSLDSFVLNNTTITLVVSSNSLTALNTFLNSAIDKVDNKKIFSKLTVDSLIADGKSGKYVLSLDGAPLSL